jgi:polysaccharide export outer membrane protein
MRRHGFALASILSLVTMTVGQCAFAQAPSSGTEQNVPILISPGDLLNISVYDNAELSQDVRVETGGFVNLNLLGPSKLAGMTAQQAGEWIAAQYVDKKYLNRPQVTVLIKEYSSQGVSVTGEVNHPGVYPLLAARSALDAISLAGGFTTLADTHVTIKHRSGAEDRVTISLKADEAGASLDENAVVYPGDLVVVPRAGVVYVLGDVGRPGGLVMQDSGRMTLLQALAQSGGANYTAAMNGAYLLHKTDSGYVTTRIKVGDMVQGKQGDMQMARNDILYIPTSKAKRFMENTRDIANTAAGAAIYHAMP